MQQLDYFIDIKIAGNHAIEKIFAQYLPSPLMSVVVDGCRQSGEITMQVEPSITPAISDQGLAPSQMP